MAKRRSPVLGYNHNVRYHGRIFHIQTEDSGPSNPHLNTHLFYEGTILASKKQTYDAEIGEEDVRGHMQTLHKSMMKELKQAVFDEKIASFFGARGEPASLEEPEMAIPSEGPGAGVARALDLDAIPIAPPPADTGGVPAAMSPPSSSGRLTSGAGVYAERTARVERPFAAQRPPADATAPTAEHPAFAPAAPRPETGAPSRTPSQPPVRRPTPGPLRPTNAPPAPVVVLQPVRRTTRPSIRSTPSAEGVVVQRQVVVGVGGAAAAPPAPRPSRTQRAMPYVIAGSTGGSRPTPPPAVAVGAKPPPPIAAAQPSAPTFRDEIDTDRSLDDVILAYLAEDADLPSE